MRISDWSSDVCSSDLHDALAVEFIGAFEFTANDTGLTPDLPRLQFSVSSQARQFGAGAGAAWGAVIRLAGAEHEVAAVEIGRASCRERVCQYVVISVGAGSLKKKNIKTKCQLK